MEENNVETQIPKENTCKCGKNLIGTLLAAFLGGFLAMYFVADQVFDRHNKIYFAPDRFERQMIKDFDKIQKQQRKLMERDLSKFNDKEVFNDFMLPAMAMDGVKIESETDDDKIEVKIGLKAFQGDENKINYNVSGRKLTITGKSAVKENGFEQNISFSQDYLLPQNADIKNITKVKDGDKLIIKVPLK